MATADPTTLTLLRAAAALHGLSLSGPAMAERVAQAGSFPGGVGAFIDAHLASQFGGLTAAEGAALVVRNLGLPPAAADAASAYLEQQVFSRPLPGQALVVALEQLSALTGHPVYGGAATAFNARLQAAQDRLLQPAGPDATWAGTLTLGLADAGPRAFELPAVSGVNSLVLVGPLNPGLADGVRGIQAGALPDLRRIELLDAGTDLRVRHLATGGLTEDTEIVLTGTAAKVAIDLRFDTLRDQGLHASSLRLELMDTRAATSTDPQTAARPLLDSPFTGFSFMVNGQVIVLQDRVEADPADPSTFNGAQTYPQLVAAVQALLARPDHLAQYPVLKGFTASLGPDFDTMDSLTGRVTAGTAIVITGPNDPTLTLERGNFIARDGVPGSWIHTVQRLERADDTDLVTSRVTLDDVGRGGFAGPVLIGLEDGAAGADAAGVQRLQLTVEGDNRLTRLTTTGDALLEVAATGGSGGLQVLGNDGQPGWRAGGAAAGDFGIVDVRTVDLSALVEPAAVDVLLTAAAATRLARPDQDTTELMFTGGQGDDRLWVQVSPSVLLDNSSRGPFSVQVDGGAGADHIVLAVGDLSGGALPPPGALRGGGLQVQGGAGDDRLQLDAPTFTVQVLMQPGFGHDVIHGFNVATDRLDLRALGGHGAQLTALASEPAVHSLKLQPQAITGARQGPGTDSAAEVAALFVPSEGAKALDAQVYIAVDANNVGHVYRVEVSAAGPVTAQLMGQIELVDTPWSALTSMNFG